jgi:hypothetical protein
LIRVRSAPMGVKRMTPEFSGPLVLRQPTC